MSNLSPEEFSSAFDEMMARRRQQMREQFDRMLPSGEVIFNRFDKARELGFGEGSSIYDTSVVMGPVEVGQKVWVGPYTLLEGLSDHLKIGDFVSIASGSAIYTHDSTRYYVSGGRVPFTKGPVTIGSYTAIGTMSVIACGVTVGSHCVIAAHSFVNHDVPDYCICAGVPAKIIGRVILEDDDVHFVYHQ
jgi:acetyltransferase-like isoleucine patch superfamily enzyme